MASKYDRKDDAHFTSFISNVVFTGATIGLLIKYLAQYKGVVITQEDITVHKITPKNAPGPQTLRFGNFSVELKASTPKVNFRTENENTKIISMEDGVESDVKLSSETIFNGLDFKEKNCEMNDVYKEHFNFTTATIPAKTFVELRGNYNGVRISASEIRPLVGTPEAKLTYVVRKMRNHRFLQGSAIAAAVSYVYYKYWDYKCRRCY